MVDLKERLLPPKPASSINLRDSSYRPSASGRQPFQAVDVLGLKKRGQGLRSWIHVDSSGNSQIIEVDKFTMMRRCDLPARDLRLLDPLFVYPSTILGREKAIVVNLEQIRCIITADEVLLLNSLDSYVLQYVVELQRRLTTPGIGEVWQSEGAELNRRRSRSFDNGFGNTSPDYLPFEFRALEVALEAACTFLDSQQEMGVYLSSPKTDKDSKDGENDKLRYGLSSMQGWRTTMEDAHAAYPDLDSLTSFFGVYDGHGGQAVAKFCSKYLHEQVLKHESYLSGDLDTSLQKAFLRMDEMMRGQRGWRELARLGDNIETVSGMIEGLMYSPRSSQVNGHFDDWPDEEGPHSGFDGPNCGSTACVAIIRNNQLVVANAGDSRCVISRKGQAYEMSKDHKPGLEVERERIRNAGGFIVVGRVNGTLNLSRAIGDAEFKQNKKLPAEQQIITANPDIKTVELCDDDEFLVLACDGIWDCMSSQQLVDYVHEQLSTETKLSEICERVFEMCLAPNTNGGEGCDNMSMILVQFKRPVQAGPSAEQQPTSSHQSMEVDKDITEK